MHIHAPQWPQTAPKCIHHKGPIIPQPPPKWPPSASTTKAPSYPQPPPKWPPKASTTKAPSYPQPPPKRPPRQSPHQAPNGPYNPIPNRGFLGGRWGLPPTWPPRPSTGPQPAPIPGGLLGGLGPSWGHMGLCPVPRVIIAPSYPSITDSLLSGSEARIVGLVTGLTATLG